MTGRIRSALGWRRILVLRLPAEAPPAPALHSVVQIERPLPDLPWAPDEIQARLAGGAKLYALESAEGLVSFGWVSMQPSFFVGEAGREIGADRPLTWIWDCVTPPSHRGRGYYPELIGRLARQVRDPVIFVMAGNQASRRGIAKAGFQPWADLLVTRWTTRLKITGAFDGSLVVIPWRE